MMLLSFCNCIWYSCFYVVRNCLDIFLVKSRLIVCMNPKKSSKQFLSKFYCIIDSCTKCILLLFIEPTFWYSFVIWNLFVFSTLLNAKHHHLEGRSTNWWSLTQTFFSIHWPLPLPGSKTRQKIRRHRLHQFSFLFFHLKIVV